MRDSVSSLRINDIVLVFDENAPRQNWCLGRIVKLILSNDDRVRGAKLVIGKSRTIIERPINKLFPIEYEHETMNCDNTIEVFNDKVNNDSDIQPNANVLIKKNNDSDILQNIDNYSTTEIRGSNVRPK